MSAVGSALVSNTQGTLQLIFSHHFMQPVYISGIENATCWFLKYCSCLRYKPCLLSAMDWQPLLKHRERSRAGAGRSRERPAQGLLCPWGWGHESPRGTEGSQLWGAGWGHPLHRLCEPPLPPGPAKLLQRIFLPRNCGELPQTSPTNLCS